MRIPTTKIDFKALGYDDYFVIVPRSVKEGFVNEITRLGGIEKDADGEEQADGSRRVNIKVLSLVQEWNLDDDKGVVLPLISAVKGKTAQDTFEKQGEITAEVPIEIIKAIIEKVTAAVRTNERTKDF